MSNKSFGGTERESFKSNASVVEERGGTASLMPPKPFFASNNNAQSPIQRFTNKTIQKQEGEEEEQIQETPITNNEFESMDDLKAKTGQTALGKYQWLKADREGQTGTWETAMVNMTKDQKPNILLPFEQVRDYYIWVTRKLDAKGHESRWVKGALYLVDELADTYDEGVTSGNWWITPGKEVIPLLEDLNVGIVNYAITQFYRLLYGDLSENPLVGEAAYQFDREFIQTEQGEVAQEVYEKYDGTEALAVMNKIFNGTGFVGNAAEALSNEIPTFPDYFKTDLEDSDSNYGRAQRIDVPLFMLYPDRHHTDENYEKQDTIFGYPVGNPRNIQDLMDQEHLDGWYESPWDKAKDPEGVYESFHDVNETIMNREW